MLAFQIVANLVNASLDVWFVAGLGWGPTGIGAGTAIAEWVALIFGLIIVLPNFRGFAPLFDRQKLIALFTANRDIMIRTLALLLCFGWFVRSSTLISTATTAGNEVLLQFITVAAFVLDGFAFVAEKEAGEAYGARNEQRLGRAMRLTSEFAFASGAAISLIYFTGGALVLETFIRDDEARAAALAYLPYCAAVPLLGIAAWQLDGLFLGTTQGRALRNARDCVSGLVYRHRYVASPGPWQCRRLDGLPDDVCLPRRSAGHICARPVQRSAPTASASELNPSASRHLTKPLFIRSTRPGPE